MSSFSKGCHHLPRIPRRNPSLKFSFLYLSGPFSPEYLQQPGLKLLRPRSFSQHLLSQLRPLLSLNGSLNGSHSLTFMSPQSICPCGHHHDFFPQSKSDTLKPYYSDCCFVNLSTLCPSIQSTNSFIPAIPQLGTTPWLPCISQPPWCWHWECLAPPYFSTRNTDPPVSSRISGEISHSLGFFSVSLFQESLADIFPVWFRSPISGLL